MWFSLSKKSKLRRQGVVKVRLNFSSEKNSQVAAQEHRHLLRIILLHELENSKVKNIYIASFLTLLFYYKYIMSNNLIIVSSNIMKQSEKSKVRFC